MKLALIFTAALTASIGAIVAVRAQQPIVQHEADSVSVSELAPPEPLPLADGSAFVPTELVFHDDSTVTGDVSLYSEDPASMTMQVSSPDYADPVVVIGFDGSVELNPNVPMDEAAKAFWQAVAKYAPCAVQP